jgi:glutaredoxin
MRKVTVYVAAGCHLCEAALEAIDGVRREVPFELDVVDIGGDPELEARHREHLPVVEVDGERAFTWFVDPLALRERLGAPAADGS